MKQHDRKPLHFAWQLVLIAAPVLLLAAIALFSIRQDRASVEQDAMDRASTLIPALGSLWQESVRKDVEAFLKYYYRTYYVPVSFAWPGGDESSNPEDLSEVRRDVVRAHINGLPRTEPAEEISYEDSRLHTRPQIRCWISDNRMEIPVEYAPLPVPPDWIYALSSEHRDLLTSLETALLHQRNPEVAGQVLSRMKDAAIPRPVLANAEFGILMLEAAQDEAADMPGKLVDFARTYPDSRSQSGTPLADLALIQVLKVDSLKTDSMDTIMDAFSDSFRWEVLRRITQYPSFFTPEIIAASKRFGPETEQALEIVWETQEAARSVLGNAQIFSSDGESEISEMWVQSNDQDFFIQRHAQDDASRYMAIIIPGDILEQAFLKAWEKTRNQIPSYLTPVVEIAGSRRQIAPGGFESPESILEAPVLATWEGGFEASFDRDSFLGSIEEFKGLIPPDNFSTVFTLNLSLARPDLLYASYQRRLWITAALIIAATATAWVGIINAWKGYRRQMKLAEMTSNFVSSVSHELRAPLASIQLMAERLEGGKVESEQKRSNYFRLIVQECRRLSGLVENVLDFSRIRQGRKRYELELIDGNALVRETVGMMEPVANERDVTLSFETDPDLELTPEWDGPAVQQAVVNLLDNAIKHSPAGSTININLRKTEDRNVQIIVTDQGPGIGKEEQERIFDSFYRLGSELRRETKGIGIGLSIVKHVAEAHGGRVFLESTPGQGSRFVLELPLKPSIERLS